MAWPYALACWVSVAVSRVTGTPLLSLQCKLSLAIIQSDHYGMCHICVSEVLLTTSGTDLNSIFMKLHAL